MIETKKTHPKINKIGIYTGKAICQSLDIETI